MPRRGRALVANYRQMAAPLKVDSGWKVKLRFVGQRRHLSQVDRWPRISDFGSMEHCFDGIDAEMD